MKPNRHSRRLLLGLCTGFLTYAAAADAPSAPAVSDFTSKAQADHARGRCGSLGPGTGLVGGKGWILSMLPGRHELRVSDGGSVFLTAARMQSLDFDAGRPYYIVIEGAPSSSVLEWKVPGRGVWAPVPLTFLYPPAGVSYAR